LEGGKVPEGFGFPLKGGIGGAVHLEGKGEKLASNSEGRRRGNGSNNEKGGFLLNKRGIQGKKKNGGGGVLCQETQKKTRTGQEIKGGKVGLQTQVPGTQNRGGKKDRKTLKGQKMHPTKSGGRTTKY